MTALDTSAPARVLTDADEAVAAAGEVAHVVARDARRRDRDRVLPEAEVDLLSRTGLLAITVPQAYGGLGASTVTVTDVVARIAAADPSVAQIPHSHLVYLRLLELAGGPQLQREVFADVLAGRRVANAQSERGGATIRDLRTTLTRRPAGGWVLEGEKYYCTGSLLADWLAVLAREDDRELVAFVPRGTPGVTVVDDWPAMGQRTTASGTVRFEAVEVPEHAVVPRAEAVTGPYGYGAYAQLLHAAIDVGIARGALAATADFVRTTARPWFEAGVTEAADDPLLLQRAGELEVDVRAARAAVRVAAERVDDVRRLRTDAAAAEASLATAAAKVLADRAALSTSSALFELGGTRSSDRTLGLDRFWRDARTHTLHDPVRWKLQHLGRSVVQDVVPPRGAQL